MIALRFAGLATLAARLAAFGAIAAGAAGFTTLAAIVIAAALRFATLSTGFTPAAGATALPCGFAPSGR